jgi:hypothetical protein
MGPCFRRDDVPKGSIHFKHASPPRRADAPELLQELPPRGRGECRMPDAPAASCAHIGSEYAHEYSQRATGITRHSRTQWFTAYFVLSPATSFLATVVMRTKSAKLDASVGASGPHDFAVRNCAVRPRQCWRCCALRPPHPAPTFVTIAKRPSIGTGWRINKTVSTERRNEIFLQTGLDTDGH